MATSTQGQILSLQGSVKAIGIDGKARLLKVGDILLPGEQLQLENGSAIDISRANGEILHVDGSRQVTLTDEILHAQPSDATEASIAPLPPEAQQILAALDNPNPGPNANPFDNLAPAAAGLTDAGGENSGHSFIRIGRITESLTGLTQESAPVSAAEVPAARAAAIETADSPPFFTAANGAPLSGDLNVTTNEDTPVSGTLTASDPDGDPLTFVKGSDPAHGAVIINPNGSWTYTPAQDYNGGDKFTVTVNDGRGGTATVTVNVGVTPVNDPAVFGGTDHGTVVEDDITQVSGTLVVKDVDVGESGFKPLADVKVDYGTFHFDSATGQWTFTLDNDKAQALTNADRFDRTFTIQSLDGTTHTVTITIQGKDDPAIITGNGGAVTEDQNVSSTNTLDDKGTLNIVDPDQGQAVFNPARVDSNAGNLGTLTIDASGNWHYSVDNAKVQYLGQGDTRTESFTVYSQDGTSHNVIVVVNGANDPANIGGAGDIGDGTVKEDTPAQTVASGKLTVVDIDQGQAQLQPYQQTTDYGTFQANADGTWTFTINNGSAKVQALGEGDTVPLQFTVTSKDGTATSVVTIHVLGTNDAAVIGGTDHGIVIEDKLLEVGGVLTVKDVDQGQSFFQAQTNIAGVYGAFSIDANGNWKYDLNNSAPIVQALNEGESRLESFVIKSADGTTSTVTVTVLGTNDVAVITPHTQGDGHGDVKEDTVLTTQGKLDITDVDTGQAFFQTQTNTAGTYGAFSIDANGNWHYNLNNSDPIVQALNEGESHIETFVVKSVDGTTSTVTVTVVGTNDIAVIDTGTGSVKEDTTLTAQGTLHITDPDAGQAFFLAQTNTAGTYGKFSIDANGNWHYNLNNSDPIVQALNEGESHIETFVVKSVDGTSSTVTVTVVGTNDIAVIDTGTGSVKEDTTLTAQGTLHITDPDAGQAFFQAQTNTAGTYGAFSIDANGNWHYNLNNSDPIVQALNEGESHIETFVVKSVDGTTSTVTVTVVGTNDVAVITPHTQGDGHGDVKEDTVLTTQGKLDITDVDTGQAFFQTQTNTAGTYGAFSIDANGNWHYNLNNSDPIVQALNEGESHIETFVVKSIDGTTSTVTVTVVGTNDIPVIDTGAGTVKEDTTLTAQGTLHITDPDAGQSFFQTQTNTAGTYGTFSIDANGNWHYNLNNSDPIVQALNEGESHIETFVVKSVDGTTSTVTVTVVGTNDVAVITPHTQGDGHGDVKEDTVLTTQGKLDITDVDTGQAFFQTQTNTAGTYGAFSIDANGNWHYNLNNSDPIVQALNEGESHIETFVVKSVDGTTSTVTVTVVGTNDVAVITPHTQGDGHGDVKEDTVLTTQGKLDITDVDTGQAFFQTQTNTAGTYGAFSIDANGNWHYNLNNSDPIVQALNEGESHIETFVVKSIDGTTSTVTVTVVGTNDIPVIDTGAGTVKEDTTLTAQGTLHITDPDAGQSFFQTQTNTAGTYGTFSIDANGNWKYNLSNSARIVQALNEGESHLETFVVKSIDGTTSTVTVTVFGTNDKASITGTSAQIIDNANGGSTGDTLHISDADAGQAVFFESIDKVEQYGEFIFNKGTGAWTFTLNDNAKNLPYGTSQIYSYLVKSLDLTDSATITITIKGVNPLSPIDGSSHGIATESVAAAHHVDAVSRETSSVVAAAGHAKAGSGEIAAAESHPHGAASHEPNIVYGAQKAAVEPAGDKPSPSIAHDTPHIADSRASHAAPDSHHPAAADAGARSGAGIETFKWTLGEQSASAKPEPARNGVADHGPRGEKDALDLKDLLPEGGHRAASLDSYLNGHKEGADAAAEARHPSPGAPAAPGPESVELTHAAALSDAQLLKNLLNHGQQHTE